MYVNAQENNEFKGLKGLKKSKNKRRIDILTAKKQRVVAVPQSGHKK